MIHGATNSGKRSLHVLAHSERLYPRPCLRQSDVMPHPPDHVKDEQIVQYLMIHNKDFPFDEVPDEELLPPRLPWRRPSPQAPNRSIGRVWDHNFIYLEPGEDTFNKEGPGAWSLSLAPRYAPNRGVNTPPPKRRRTRTHQRRRPKSQVSTHSSAL